MKFEELELKTQKKGDNDFIVTFNKPGKYRIVLEVDDGYNQDRYDLVMSPINCSWSEISKYSWIDSINLTVLPYITIEKVVI